MEDYSLILSFTSWANRVGLSVYRLLILLLALGTSHAYSQNSYDIIISNGRVIDGSGNPWYEADIAINGEHIVRIGDLSLDTANQVINAEGLTVTPGFIDPHTHALRGILDVPNVESSLLQGVTTLTEGYFADITVFDANEVIDKATFEDPHQYAIGIKFVLVNGEIVVEGGQHTGKRPGKIIYGPGYNDDN